MIEKTTPACGSASERLDVRIDQWVHKQTVALAPHIDPNDTVLECGCGDGRVLAALSGRTKAGVEASPAAARLARGRGLDIRATIDDFSGTRFSRILYSPALDATSNSTKSLATVRAFLTEEGLLLISQPVPGDTLRSGTWRAQSEMPSQLARLLIDAGFEPQEVAFQRRTYRSAGFRFAAGDSMNQASDQKTFWTVTPFLALIAVASAKR